MRRWSWRRLYIDLQAGPCIHQRKVTEVRQVLQVYLDCQVWKVVQVHEVPQVWLINVQNLFTLLLRLQALLKLTLGDRAFSVAASRAWNHWRIQNFNLGGPHGERGVRAYNGGLGAEPPVGSRGRAPGHGAKPPEAESILALGRPTVTANLHPWPVAVFSV